MTRSACCLATEGVFNVVAPVHDACRRFAFHRNGLRVDESCWPKSSIQYRHSVGAVLILRIRGPREVPNRRDQRHGHGSCLHSRLGRAQEGVSEAGQRIGTFYAAEKTSGTMAGWETRI
jgi:hypothetical protein